MRRLFSGLAAAALSLAALAGAARAQVLASADNPATTTLMSPGGYFYSVDGSTNALGFSTIRTNEAVQLSFTAALCGVQQIKPQLYNLLTDSEVRAMLYVDGRPVRAGLVPLCAYAIMPVGQGFEASGKGKLQYRFVVPTPGNHTAQILISPVVTSNSSSLYPWLGETHLMVWH